MGRTGSYRLTPRRGGFEHPELLPAREAAPAARAVRPDADRGRRRHASTSTAALEAMRSALVGHGLPYRVESTADLAILQFAKFRLWKDLDEHWADFAENPLVSHLVHEPTEAFEDPARDTGGFVDLDELAAAAARARRRLAAAGDRRGGRRPHLRARGPARHRQVADHHQPAHPRRRRRQAGAVRRREARGPGRRRAPARRGRHGHVRPRPARQGLARLDGARPDPARARARGRRRRAGPGRRRRGAAVVPPDARPLRRPAARRQRRRAVAVLGADGGAHRRHRRRAAAGARAVRRQRAGRGAAVGPASRSRCCPTSPT